jgi:hypothetical protein
VSTPFLGSLSALFSARPRWPRSFMWIVPELVTAFLAAWLQVVTAGQDADSRRGNEGHGGYQCGARGLATRIRGQSCRATRLLSRVLMKAAISRPSPKIISPECWKPAVEPPPD